MKKRTQLVLANIFALVVVVSIYILTKLMGIEISLESGPILPKILLVLLPQAGFIYLFWNLPKTEKVTA